MQFRIGIGQDSHKIISNFQFPISKNKKPLILAGILIDKNIEVVANSDGDVIAHAVCNALSSAAGGRSISFYADVLCKKGVINSFEYIKEVLKKEVAPKGFKINNVSISVEAGKPKLEKFHHRMKKNLAKVLAILEDQIGLTFSSGERLTAFGRGEGIQVFCALSLIKQ